MLKLFKTVVLFIIPLIAACDIRSSGNPPEEVTGCYQYSGSNYVDEICINDDLTYTQNMTRDGSLLKTNSGKWSSLEPKRILDGKEFTEISFNELQIIVDKNTGNYRTGAGVYIRPEQHGDDLISFVIYDDNQEEMEYIKVL